MAKAFGILIFVVPALKDGAKDGAKRMTANELSRLNYHIIYLTNPN